MATFTINSKIIEIVPGRSILDHALASGVEIPHFCDHPLLEKFGGCRMCLVEVKGAHKLEASCTLAPREGMEVQTETPAVIKARSDMLEFILINHPLDCPTCDKAGECVLQDYSMVYGAAAGRFEETKAREPESATDPLIVRNMERCIMCTRCVRACSGLQGAYAISVVGRGKQSFIEPFDKKRFNCDYCGSCITVCPVGALMSKLHRHNYRPWETDRRVETICTHCGVGCSMVLPMRGQRIQRTEPIPGLGVNDGILCARGYFGYEYVGNPRRLDSPLIRRDGKLAKTGIEEALSHAVRGFQEISQKYGPDAIAGIGSVRCTNEDNYMFQKFMRAGLGTNNIDTAARMGIAGPRRMLDSLLGPGSTANEMNAILKSDAVIVAGGDPTTLVPVLGVRIRQAADADTRVISIGHAPGLFRHSRIKVASAPLAESEALAALLRLLIKEQGLKPSNHSTERIGRIANEMESATLDELSGLMDTSALMDAARALAASKSVSIVIGRGLWQQEDGARGLLATAALAHLLRAKIYLMSEGANENGAIDAGCLPDRLPGGATLVSEYKEKLEAAWGAQIPSKPGSSLMEIFERIHKGEIKALYIMGENPAFNLPDSQFIEEALAKLELLVVQDIFLNETTTYAHVLLPAKGWTEKSGTMTNLERRIQRLGKAREGAGLADWELLVRACRAAGVKAEHSSHDEILKEMSRLSPLMKGFESSADIAGKSALFPYKSALPEPESPAVDERLIRSRQLTKMPKTLVIHTKSLFHPGTTTRHSDDLRSVQQEPLGLISEGTASELGLKAGDTLRLSTNKSLIDVMITIDISIPYGVVCISSVFKGACINALFEHSVEPVTMAPYARASEIKLEKVGL